MKDEAVDVAEEEALRKRSIRVDLTEEELADVGLADEVRLVITGKVKSISAPYEYVNHDGKKKKLVKDKYGDLSLKVSSVKIEKDSDNEFEELSKDDD